MSHQLVIVLDFGGQYNQLIARRVRECGVYCEVLPYTTPLSALRERSPVGIIFTGGPDSVYLEDAPRYDPEIFRLGVPILGICYGCQLMAHTLGGQVTAAQQDTAREYGKTLTHYDTGCKLFHGLPEEGISWMSHGDYMARVPEGFALTARSAACPNVAIADEARGFYGVQFHPEVNHTQHGLEMLRNFLYLVCGAVGDWNMGDYCRTAIQRIRQTVGPEGRVLLGLSGGVDSSVLAALLSEAIGDRLTCVFVDHGLMRLGEADQVEATFSTRALRFLRVDAEQRFLSRLAGVTDPEEKRKIIGREFGLVFVEQALRFGITKQDYFAQGTIYPDVVESGKGGESATIKTHHNTALPRELLDQFAGVLEPLRLLFKDEVRQLGRELGLPSALVDRQPFPGPGLGIRILGEVTKPRADLLRKADAIFREVIAQAGLEDQISQYFAVLTDARSVGVMGDSRTYDAVVVLRGVTTDDFMTADWARIPYEVLDAASRQIVNQVPGVNRIVYDITSKPPATVEWE